MASVRWALAFAACAVAAGPAAGQTAISYSAPENAYGWCVDFNGPRAAAACAQRWCAESGGASCRVVLTCSGGWSAVALTESPLYGMAAICGTTSRDSAQMLALAHCTAANNTLCWSDSVFDGQANALPADRVEEFDRTFYSQALLQLTGAPVELADGLMSAGTREAVVAFQRKVGLDATGSTESPLIFNLIAAAGGRQVLIDELREEIADKYEREYADILFAAAPAPIPARAIAGDLAALSEVDRATAMRSFLRSSDMDCADPVTVSLLPDGFDDLVTVDCAGQGYTVIVTDGTRVITRQ
jgi:hypothetical protein